MSNPKDKPLTLGSATVGPVRKLTMKDLLADAKPAIAATCKREGLDLVQDPDESAKEIDKDAVAARLVKHAVLNRYGMYNSATSGDPSVYIAPIWIRGDGSIPWEHPPLAETEDAVRQAAEDVAQEVLKADEAMRQAAEDVARVAADLAEEFQASVRNSACAAAQWTWDALGNFAEHQAPPIADAVEIALRHAANEACATAKEKRWAELARAAAETTDAKDNPRDWIAREVHPHLGALRDKLRAVGMKVWRPFLYTDEPPEDDAMEAAEKADNLLADYLAAELDAASIAKNIRTSIAERQESAHQHDTNGNEERGKAWKLWFNPIGNPPLGPFPFLTLLALAVWRAKVRPTLEEARRAQELAAKHVAGLTLDLFGSVADRHRKARNIEVTADGFKAIDDAGRRVHLADLPAEVPLKLLEGAPRALATIHTYDMAVWAITQGARESWAKPQRGESGRWRFHGGKHVAALVQGLETIEAPGIDARRGVSPKVAKQYEEAAIALMVPFPDPHNPGGVLSLAGGRVTPGRGRRPTIIEMDLAGWALPGDVYDRMGKGHNARARASGKIVPLPTGRPKLLGHPYERIAGPSAWNFARIVAAIRLRAADVARGDGAHLPRRVLAQLAEEAGLDPKWIPDLLALWLDAGAGPADLERLGRDRYHVGEAHRTARLNVEQEGKKEARGAKGIPPARKVTKSKKK